jgi:uncharacterized protein (UPF0335 family)
MSDTFVPFDVIRQAAMSTQSEVERSAQMAKPQIPDTSDILQEAAMVMSELTNPGHFTRIASGVAKGMMESPNPDNRAMGAAMAETMGYDTAEIQKKVGLYGQFELLAAAKMDRIRKQIELKDLPDKMAREKAQAEAELAQTKAATESTAVRTQGQKISNMLEQSSYLSAEEKRKYLPEALRLEQNIDRAKLRSSEAEAGLREAELDNSPEVSRMQKELTQSRIEEIKAQRDANIAHGRYFNAQALKESAELDRIKNQLPPELLKTITEDYQYSTNQMKSLVDAQDRLVTQKQKLIENIAEIQSKVKGSGYESLSDSARQNLIAKKQEELNRIESDMRATNAMKVQVWNNREMFRNEVMAPYLGGRKYAPYGTNPYRPAVASGSGPAGDDGMAPAHEPSVPGITYPGISESISGAMGGTTSPYTTEDPLGFGGGGK